MLVYLASPTTQLHADCMAGQPVLESFAIAATKSWMDRYRPTFSHVMLDSGAYSEMTSGKPVDLGAYVAFCQAHAAGYDEIVNLDVISGDVGERVDAGQRNLQTMRDSGLDPMPVFHQGEPWSVLEDLAACGRVGLGLQRPMRGVEAFLDECFSRVGKARVHGFALANARWTKRYPFFSVDSATWVHEMNALCSVKGQGADVLACLTPAELLRMVVKKYERLPRASAWAGPSNLALFEEP